MFHTFKNPFLHLLCSLKMAMLFGLVARQTFSTAHIFLDPRDLSFEERKDLLGHELGSSSCSLLQS